MKQLPNAAAQIHWAASRSIIAKFAGQMRPPVQYGASLNQRRQASMPLQDPHKSCTIHYAAAPLETARHVVIAVHGRYGTAADILKHQQQVNVQNTAWIAPQAHDRSWWPESFLAPLTANEPGISSALNRITAIADDLEETGIGAERIVLFGFSQGACLLLEHAARHPRPWRGIVAMSGGLLGSAETNEPPRSALLGHSEKRFDYTAALDAVPIQMGCHSGDPVIPLARVRNSAEVLQKLGAQVSLKVRNGNMHAPLQSDLVALRSLLNP